MFYPLYPIGIGAEWWLLYRAIAPGAEVSPVIPPIFYFCLLLYIPGKLRYLKASCTSDTDSNPRLLQNVYVHDQAEKEDTQRDEKNPMMHFGPGCANQYPRTSSIWAGFPRNRDFHMADGSCALIMRSWRVQQRHSARCSCKSSLLQTQYKFYQRVTSPFFSTPILSSPQQNCHNMYACLRPFS